MSAPKALLLTPFDDTLSLFTDPISQSSSNPSAPALILPATYQRRKQSALPTKRGDHGRREVAAAVPVAADRTRFVAAELDLSQLNRIHAHLWLAGLERPARALHQQLAIGRRVQLTETADLHLLWWDDLIYIKPLPDFLLCSAVWTEILNQDRELHERACGFLLSYLWLVSHRSDWRAARAAGLLAPEIEWADWTRFARSVADHLDLQTFNGINIRYRYGELRLTRINIITRFCSRSRNLTTVLRGYFFGHYSYPSFFTANLTWLLSVIVYITVVLTAMQVGLATTQLQGSATFQSASYGFTIFAILAPLAAVSVVGVLGIVLAIFNYQYTLKHAMDWSGVEALQYDHSGAKLPPAKRGA